MTLDPRQEAQLKTFLEWVEKEGQVEGPTRLDTLMQPHQIQRLNWLKRNSTGRILEVGCNFGFVLAWVGGHVGVDINPMNIELARVLTAEREFHWADARALPFPNRSFDTVMLPELLEHLEHPILDVKDGLDLGANAPKALGEAKRVARKRILITCPDGRTENEMAANFKHPYLMDEEHIERVRLYLWPFRTRVLLRHGFVFIRCDLEGK